MDEPKYYLFYRIDDGEWKSVFYRSFLTSASIDHIYGQFISSSWFSLALDRTEHVVLMVVRLGASHRFVHDALCEQLHESVTLPEFVVAYERFEFRELKAQLTQKVLEGGMGRLTHHESRPHMGVSVHALRTGDSSVQHTLCCPTFVLSKN